MCLSLRDAVLIRWASCYIYGVFMTDFELWLEKNNTIKSYAHFDRRISIKSVLSDIENPEKIAKHSFMPFIHYELKFQKYSKTYFQYTCHNSSGLMENKKKKNL